MYPDEWRCPKDSTLLYMEAPGWWKCATCGLEVLEGDPDEDDFRSAGELWKDEQHVKRTLSKPGSHSSKGRKRHDEKKRWNSRENVLVTT